MQAHRPPLRVRTLLQALCVISLGSGLALSAHAQTAASQAASAAPSNEAAEVQRLIKEGQHAQALKLIDEFLSRNPKDAQMRFRRGVALSMLDRKAEALSVFQKLVEDHPDMPAPYNNMAVIYGAQGDYEKARGALERAIRTNPAYATAYQNLGDVYAQLASQAYTKALQLDKNDTSVQPKLSLLRELTSTPGGAAPAAVASTKTPAPPTPAAAPPAPVAAVKPAPASTPTTVAAAAKPAPAASVAPAPAPKPVETKPAANANGDVDQAVKAWAAAWSRRDMPAYYAAYAADYRGQASSHKAWEQERRDRIAGKRSIRVSVSDLKIAVNGDKATVHFRQSYDSDALSTTSRKTLELVRAGGGKWVIRQESVGG
jgi:Flp pilus assembly protein TadD/ketosteroid isomerase-like protein